MAGAGFFRPRQGFAHEFSGIFYIPARKNICAHLPVMNSVPNFLPRLAYIGEVPVRSISAGPALLHRLLESYPRDRLMLCESADNKPSPNHELAGVAKLPFTLLHRRLLQTRLNEYYGAWIYYRAAARGRALVRRLRAWHCEAVLGLAHGFAWISADAVSRTLGVPLHLIVHDHWRSFISLPARFNAKADAQFGACYRSAASRLPVSPDMEAYYRHSYGASGTIVYPSRAAGALRLAHAPLRVATPGAFIFAYAGSAQSSGQRRALANFANTIAPLGARLRIYQGLTHEALRADGLRTDNVEIAPFLPVDELHRELVSAVDGMFLPMSYASEDRANVELCFPSKLADYTVAGLPILVHAPEYGTATRWAWANPQAGELVTSSEPALLAVAARRIIEDTVHRQALARGALEVGEKMFAHDSVYQIFCNALIIKPARVIPAEANPAAFA